MLELRPSCEHCDKRLAPDSPDAMICSYECTFCADCVKNILENVCPNCGGGFVPRPARPVLAWRKGVSLSNHPASSKKILKPVDATTHKSFAAKVKAIPPYER